MSLLISFEKALLDDQRVCSKLIAGVDEAGRGSLAGPVFAACVILDHDDPPADLNDSKLLTPKKRETVFADIMKKAVSWSVGQASHEEVDRINVLQATLLAMKRAVEALKLKPDFMLVDGRCKVDCEVPQKDVIGGDRSCASIAAASIVAKVLRDRHMCELEKKYPNFSFSVHKGYGTMRHLDELKKFGPTSIHRLTFAGVVHKP